MSITVRLDPALERKLSFFSKKKLRTKSEIIKESLRRYLGQEESTPTAYELGKDLFGKYGSGRKDLSTNKKLLKEKIRAKNFG